MKYRFARLVLVLMLAIPGRAWAGFPEIPFCPLGGPPGWVNILFDSDDNHYPPPYPPYRRPYPVAPPYYPPAYYPLPPAPNWRRN